MKKNEEFENFDRGMPLCEDQAMKPATTENDCDGRHSVNV